MAVSNMRDVFLNIVSLRFSLYATAYFWYIWMLMPKIATAVFSRADSNSWKKCSWKYVSWTVFVIDTPDFLNPILSPRQCKLAKHFFSSLWALLIGWTHLKSILILFLPRKVMMLVILGNRNLHTLRKKIRIFLTVSGHFILSNFNLCNFNRCHFNRSQFQPIAFSTVCNFDLN